MSQRLNSYFSSSRELRDAGLAARKLATLQQHYLRIVPARLARASRVHWLTGRTLVLAADNSAVAAKLRQLAPDLAAQLGQMGDEVTGIQVKVQVDAQPRHGARSAERKLSQTGRRQMSELARELPDSPLKDALQRFVRHTGDGEPD